MTDMYYVLQNNYTDTCTSAMICTNVNTLHTDLYNTYIMQLFDTGTNPSQAETA